MAAQDKNSFSEVWDQLDPKYAERVRVTEATALGDEEIVRRWPQIGEGYLSKCVTALSLFTDSTNSKPQLWVKDPVVGRETFPGIYRSVTVDVDTQKPGLKGIIQTLRKGFATAPQWSEARLEAKVTALSNNQSADGLAGTTSDPVDRVFDVLFPNCSPLSIDNIAGTLRIGDYSGGITVRGELHAGAWHVLSVSTKLEEDGSASAILRVATPQYTISAYDDYGLDRAMDVHYVMDVPKEQAQGIVTAWKAANPVGASATISYSRDQKLVDIVLRKTASVEAAFAVGLVAADCRYLETETIYLNVADSTAYPIAAPTNGGGISYVRNVTRNINGTWDISIKARASRYRDTGFMTVEETGAQKTEQRQQLGLTRESPEAVVPTAGAAISQRIEIRDDCSKDVVTAKEVGKEQISTSNVEAAGYRETTTEKTVQTSPASAPVQADGHIRTSRTQPSKYHGRYDTQETDREVKLLSASSVGGGPLVEEVSVVSKNADSDLSGESAGGDGVIVDTDSQKNEAGKFDNRKKIRTAKKRSQAFSSGSPLVSESVVITKNGSVQSPGLPAEGTIHDASNSINEFGKIDSTKVVRTAIQKQKVFSTGGGLSSEQVTVTKNGEVPNPGTGGAGVITDASASVNEFGKVDSVVSVRTAKTATATSVSGGPLSVETEVVTKNGEAQSPGAGGIGTIKRVGQSINEFGKVDSQVSTIVAVQSAPAISVHGSPLVKVETETVKNGSAVSPGQGEAGVIVDVNQSVNEFGKIDSTKTKQTAVFAEAISNSGGALFTEEDHVRVNGEAQSPGDGAAGVVKRASNSINAFGKIDSRVSTVTDKPFDTGLVSTGGDSLKTEQSQIKLNQQSVSVSPVAGKVVSAGISVGESGLINARITQLTPIASDSGWIGYQDRYGTSYFRSFRNQASVPTDGFTSDTSNSLSASKNEYGLWDGTASRSAVRDASGGSTDPDVEIDYTINVNGISYDIDEKITGSLSRAQTHIAGTNTGGSGKTPGIVYIGHGKYKATKVTISP